jgi:hypothetical protein
LLLLLSPYIVTVFYSDKTMSTIDYRLGKYRARVYVPGAARITRTFEIKVEAEEWANQQEQLIKKVLATAELRYREEQQAQALNVPQPDTTSCFTSPEPSTLEYQTPTLFDALTRYGEQVSSKKKGEANELGLIKRWQRHPLAAFPLLAIRGKQLSTYRDLRLQAGIAGNTVRLDLMLISHLYEIARKEWGHENLQNPIRNVRMPKVARGRTRRLQGGELERLTA